MQLYYIHTSHYPDQINVAYTLNCFTCRTGASSHPLECRTMLFRWIWSAFSRTWSAVLGQYHCTLPQNIGVKYGLREGICYQPFLKVFIRCISVKGGQMTHFVIVWFLQQWCPSQPPRLKRVPHDALYSIHKYRVETIIPTQSTSLISMCFFCLGILAFLFLVLSNQDMVEK